MSRAGRQRSDAVRPGDPAHPLRFDGAVRRYGRYRDPGRPGSRHLRPQAAAGSPPRRHAGQDHDGGVRREPRALRLAGGGALRAHPLDGPSRAAGRTCLQRRLLHDHELRATRARCGHAGGDRHRRCLGVRAGVPPDAERAPPRRAGRSRDLGVRRRPRHRARRARRGPGPRHHRPRGRGAPGDDGRGLPRPGRDGLRRVGHATRERAPAREPSRLAADRPPVHRRRLDRARDAARDPGARHAEPAVRDHRARDLRLADRAGGSAHRPRVTGWWGRCS